MLDMPFDFWLGNCDGDGNQETALPSKSAAKGCGHLRPGMVSVIHSIQLGEMSLIWFGISSKAIYATNI